ncbi:MAG: HD domain-containing protein [Chloroflexia bacterium]|nr:HD domain-containing protein [Chloroflexia bacterium]
MLNETKLLNWDMSRGDGDAAAGLVRFLILAGRLKRLARTGWLHSGVPAAEVESVADHSFRTALLAWVAAGQEPGLDRERVLAMALVHDLAEALAGDPTPYDPDHLATLDPEARRAFLGRRQVRSTTRQAAKHAAEREAIETMLATLPERDAASIRALWEEVESGRTAEARFVKGADRLERYLQAREYGAADPSLPLGSFAADLEGDDLPDSLATLRDAIRGLDDGDIAGDGASSPV